MPHPNPPNFEADRWGDSWSEQGVILRFGSSSMVTAVKLDARGAANLAAELRTTVAQLEAMHGTLWSEDAMGNGLATKTALPLEDQGSIAGEALWIYRLVKNLPLDGIEQSFKLRDEELLENRFLVGISRSKLPDEDLHYLAAKMGAPEEVCRAIRNHLEKSIFFHVGFEQGKQGNTFKLYLEFPLTEDSEKNGFQPLYLGFKWNPQDPLRHGISTYAQPRNLERAILLTRVTSSFDGLDCPASRAAVQIIQLAANKAPEKSLSLVEVRESNSPRTSFDVNLYDTGLTIDDLAPVLTSLANELKITENFKELIQRTHMQLAGHVSGGTDRLGRSFLTIYHAHQRSASKR